MDEVTPRSDRPQLPGSAAHHRVQRILAVSSGGGHWVQLLRLRPAMERSATIENGNCNGRQGCPTRVTYVTVNKAYAADVPGERFRVVPDATRWNKVKLVWMGLRLAWIMLLERPDVVISTGAAPGFVAVRIGRLMRCRTLWLDSVANIEQLSLSGQLICGKADLVLTQWPHLAGEGGSVPLYKGSVL